MDYRCEKCGNELPEDALFCSKCGEKVAALRCPNCGKQLPEDSMFCTYCGAKISIAPQMPEESAAPETAQPPDSGQPESVPAAGGADTATGKPQPTEQAESNVRPAEDREAGSGNTQDAPAPIEVPVEAPAVPVREQPADARAAEAGYTGDLSEVVIKNTQYYLPEFEKAKRNEKCRFNWAAFFLNGAFAYYRRSQEIFWRYYKWPFITCAAIALCITVSGFGAAGSYARLGTWLIAALLLGAGANLWLLITNIRFGKNFNKEYYQHCMAQAERSGVPPRAAGTSVKNAIFYWIVVSLCFGAVSGLAGGLLSAAFLSGISGGLDGDGGILSQEESPASETIGCWKLVEYEQDGAIWSVEDSSEFEMYFVFHEDYTADLYFFEDGTEDSSVAAWEYGDDTIRLTVPGEEETWFLVRDGEQLTMPVDDEILRFRKLSAEDCLPEEVSRQVASQSTLSVSDFVGEYTYDASFENPDGTYTNFCYSLSVEPSDNGVLITEVWRGIYSFCDDFASKNDLEGDTLYFVVKYGDNAGTHSLTYVPAAQSAYDRDTIYIDGNTEMPYLRDSYVADTSYDSTVNSAPFANFIGTWQDENDGSAYLFVGYGDETEQAAYAYALVPTGDYQVQLIEDGSSNAFGHFMGYGSEPEFSLYLTREPGWIDAEVSYGSSGLEKSYRFFPVDPASCAYRNPYYVNGVSGEAENDPCANDYDFGSGDTVYDYALDASSGYDFNHEPENWGNLVNGFNALNENLIGNFWDIVDAMN